MEIVQGYFINEYEADRPRKLLYVCFLLQASIDKRILTFLKPRPTTSIPCTRGNKNVISKIIKHRHGIDSRERV